MTESDCKQTIDGLFKCAINIERKASDIYKELADLFFLIPKVAAFWNGLSKDEIVHMEMLQNIYKSLTKEQLLSLSDEKIWDDIIKIQNILNKDLIGSIKNLDDAYELAHEIEFSEINAIFQFLATKFVPSEERKKFVISEIKQHQQKLSDFSNNFGDRYWRRKISIL
ncbi:MAG TPA: hypothetical protein ENH29_00635 [Bacteroidetes bacterium]|nr:hypothetical protein [Bacteroidota bacterium]